jgi:hypothetical protein
MGKGKIPNIIHHQRIKIIKKDVLKIMRIGVVFVKNTPPVPFGFLIQ